MIAARRGMLLALLALCAPAGAQDAPPPAEVERVYVPKKGFERVLRKHPRGVFVEDAELRALLERAGTKPLPPKPEAPAPVATSTTQSWSL